MIVVIALITILAVFPFRGSVGLIVRVIPVSALILEERVPVSVLDIKFPWVAACKAMHNIDYILRKGGSSNSFSVQFFSGGEAHE